MMGHTEQFEVQMDRIGQVKAGDGMWWVVGDSVEGSGRRIR